MQYELFIRIGEVEASSQEEAVKKSKELLQELASSNDGSEILANAKPIVGTLAT